MKKIFKLLLLGFCLGLVYGCFTKEKEELVVETEKPTYDIVQQEISKVNFSIKNNDLLNGSVQLTKNRSLDLQTILDDQETPLFENFAKVDVPSSLRRNPETSESMNFDLEMKLEEEIDSILAYNEETEEISYLPYFEDGKNQIKINLNSEENISILPIKEPIEKSIETDSSTRIVDILAVYAAFKTLFGEVKLPAVISNKKPFTVEKNDGKTLTVKYQQSYFDNWWMRKPFMASYFKVGSGGYTKLKNGERVTIPINQSGIYTFKVYIGWKSRYIRRFKIREKTHTRLKWTQDVFVQKSNDLPTNFDSLAQKYAPIVMKEYGEEYNPSSLEYIFNKENPSSNLNKEIFAVSTIKGTRYFTYKNIDQALKHYGSNNSVLDSFLITKNWTTAMKARKNKDNPTVYYSGIKKGDRLFVNYHFLYPFDGKGFKSFFMEGAVVSGTANKGGNHLFDRESLTIVFDYKSQKPIDILYGAHLPTQKLKAHGQTITNSASRVTFEKAHKLGNHPVAYLAGGAHAVYPYAGITEIGILKERSGYFHKTPLEEVMVPKGLYNSISDKDLISYTLKDLEIGKIEASKFNGNLSYSGYLVDVLGPENAKFPPFTGRETNPESYYSKATKFDMDKIFATDKSIMKKIIKFLDENIKFTK